MSAGLPGVGLSGIFFIVSALAAVPLEVGRTLRRRSSLARWAAVLRHFAFAVVMIASLELFYATVHLGLAHLPDVGHVAHGVLAGGGAGSGLRLHAIPVLPVLATLGLVACVIALAKGAELVSRVSQRAPAFSPAATGTTRWPSSHSTTSPQANAPNYQAVRRKTSVDRVADAVDVRSIARAAAARGLLVLMAAGSLAVWTLIPLGGLWLASRLSDSSTGLPIGPALVVVGGIPAAMLLVTRALVLLERSYTRVKETNARARRLPARRYDTGDRDSRPRTSVLEKIMVANVIVALGALAIWVLPLAGSGFSA
jgi:hypothetical protein